MQHEGSSEFLGSLRRAAHAARVLAAQAIGTTAIAAGSYVAKKILESIPEPRSVHDTAPAGSAPGTPEHQSHAHPKRAA